MMLIMLVIGLKENQPVETVSFLVKIWYPGLAKDKQIVMSIAEAKYISAASCCTQLLWMKHQLEDYQISANNIPIYLFVKESNSTFKGQAYWNQTPLY